MKARLRYSILDPTGNITALVESAVEPERQPAAAAALMERHPAVEQVGFVRFFPSGPVCGTLRMAGGEFCGNASLSAAALYLIRRQEGGEALPLAEEISVLLRVSGAEKPVELRLRREGKDRFQGGVHMPPALGVEERPFSHGAFRGQLPLVRMEGISHLIVPTGSPFFNLKADPAAAERAVRGWCEDLSAEGLGLMFLEESPSGGILTPLVYIPGGASGSGTLFWENSCASGSAAAGIYLAARSGAPVELSLAEPGGSLRVRSEPAGETWLWGRTRLTETLELSFG